MNESRELPVPTTFTLRLRDAADKKPTGNLDARIVRQSPDGKDDVEVFAGRVGPAGELDVTLASTAGNLKLIVSGLDREQLATQHIKIKPDTPAMVVDLKLDDYKARVASPLANWEKALRKAIPAKAAALLKQHKIASFDDFRVHAADLAKAELAGGDGDAVRELQRHAELQLVSRDHRRNQQLIDAGLADVFTIAATPLAEVIKRMGGDQQAAEIHAEAVAKVQVMKNVALDRRVRRASGVAQAQQMMVAGADEEPLPCSCDCQSAVSPLAYLADLLDFALREVTYDNNAVTIASLEAAFHQPLGSLPGDCSASENEVRQVRLCIEVLRRKALADGKDPLTSPGVVQHPSVAYEAILRALGTSARELRLLRGASDRDRTRKAQGLGISLAQLPGLSIAPADLSEVTLEALFGWQDTARDPLSSGAKLNDLPGNHVLRWQLKGVEWKRSTDAQGRIHATLTKQPNQVTVDFYADAARTLLVAKADGPIAAGAPSDLIVAGQNDSGVYGRVLISPLATTKDFAIAAVPEFLTWQLAGLRQRWRDEDHPAAAYTLPIVDPDVVTDAHVCRPFAANPAHAMLVARRAELGQARAKLDKKSSGAARTVSEMIAEVWPAAPAWNAIAADLISNDAATVTARLNELATKHLSAEAFAYLNELRQRPAPAAALVDPEAILREQAERDAALDILLNVLKRRDLYPAWLAAENAIVLSPQFFCEPLVPAAAINPLLAGADQAARRSEELARNSRPPIVDPDVIDAVPNLAPPVGAVLDRVNERRVLLATLAGHLEALPAGTLTAAWLDARLGGSDLAQGGTTLLHHLGLAGLDALQAQIDAGTLGLDPGQHGVTGRELNALMAVRKVVKAGAADAGDWRQVFQILIQAEKRRYLFPRWLAEEATDNLTLSPDAFRLPLEMLPAVPPPAAADVLEWRSPAAVRRQWLAMLRSRVQQSAAVTDALRAATDAAEEAALPPLRDALVDLVYDDPAYLSRDARKKAATNALLINAFESGCRKTTRVAQAIECLQLLVWGILNRQIEDAKFRLPQQDQEPFQASWRWLQAYGTWRAAMFVFLYPELVLSPTLRRQEHQTPLFKSIVFLATMGPAAADPSVASDQRPPLVDYLLSRLDGTALSSPKGMQQIVSELAKIRLERTSEVMVVGDFIPANFLAANPRNVIIRTTRLLSGQSTEPRLQPCYYLSEQALLEDQYHIPLYFGLLRQAEHDFASALEFFYQARTGYFSALTMADDPAAAISRSDEWLADPLDPHGLAASRAGVAWRALQITIARCLLDYAEAEFTTDTSESLARARELYFTAQAMLDRIGGAPVAGGCDIRRLITEVGETYYMQRDIRDAVLDVLLLEGILRIPADRVAAIVENIDKVVKGARGRAPSRRELQDAVRKQVKSFRSTPALVTVGERRQRAGGKASEAMRATLNDGKVFAAVRDTGMSKTAPAPQVRHALAAPGWWPGGLGGKVITDTEVKIPGVVFEFCVPPNPVLLALHLRCATGLIKLSNCMNLAGLRREVPTYSAPTDTRSGLPVVGGGGGLAMPQAMRVQGTQYRYKVLIERAKQLVGIAQQMEASYLSFIEKRDQEDYSILRARHDLGLADANVALQALRVTEAGHGQTLAQSQVDRVTETLDYYEGLIHAGELDSESLAFWLLITAASIQGVGAVVGGIAGGAAGALPSGGLGGPLGAVIGATAGALASGGQAVATLSSAAQIVASAERRKQEWVFQRDLADIDVTIAGIEQMLADDRAAIVTQEQAIAQLGAGNAEDVLNFLSNKFTSAELYGWMSGVIAEVYRYCLQQATAMAKLAQTQLAFERQEVGIDFILGDYWAVTYRGDNPSGNGDTAPERRGMTGSARLLHDIYRLDQHAFTTDRRKLQMSKTISLAMHDPIVFQQFRATGSLPFQTTMAMFDRDFPGHYLRLIKRVRTSVIALIPPTHGIKASLSSTGISRVVVSADANRFEERAIARQPESVALTSATNDGGVFELQEQPDMLLPFEGLGLANSWEFTLPRAANVLDYSTVADVLVTVEYTAMDSPLYRHEVIERVRGPVSSDRGFSFRHHFADAWYDLHHAELAQPPHAPLAVSFTTRRADFPPNLSELRIQHVALYVARAPGVTVEIDIDDLRFSEDGRPGSAGGPASTVQGIASTRRSGAGGWAAMIGRSPVGVWTLTLNDDAAGVTRGLFENREIEDILLVVTIEGSAPEWPS